MKRRHLHVALSVASVAIVLMAAAMSANDRWNFDFAQYKGPQRPAPRDEFRFVMVGDRTGGRVPGLMPQAFREINYLYPEFVISVGDLIDGPASTPERIEQFWREFDDEVALLKAPFVYVPGNHDVWNATSKGIYEQRYGPTYRSFNYRGLHFITLDTEEFDEAGRKLDRIDGKQLEWLKEDIAQNRNADAILVLMHKPIWLSGGLDKAEEIWKGLPVYVFAGHVHRYSYQVIHGIPHIILGAVAGGMREHGDAIGRFRHYMLVTVRDGKLNFGLVRLGGVLAPEVVLEEELPGIRLLADSFAIVDGVAGGESPRLVARNPLASPIKLQVQKTSYGPGKPATESLFRGTEPVLAADDVLEKTLDGPELRGTQAAATEFKALVEFTNSQGQKQQMDFPVDPRPRPIARAKPCAAAPTIDGDLSEWVQSDWHAIGVGRGAASTNPQDLSAQFAMSFDEQYLYLAVKVTDDVVAYHLSPGDCDGIELFTARPAKGEISYSRDSDWRRWVITPFVAGGQPPGEPSGTPRVVASGKNGGPARAAFVRSMNGYVIELALLRADLRWNGTSNAGHQFDLAINDRDVGTRRETQIYWSGDDRDQLSSRHYGEVILGSD